METSHYRSSSKILAGVRGQRIAGSVDFKKPRSLSMVGQSQHRNSYLQQRGSTTENLGTARGPWHTSNLGWTQKPFPAWSFWPEHTKTRARKRSLMDVAEGIQAVGGLFEGLV